MLVLVLIFFISTFGMNFQITTPLLAKQVFHRGAAGYGLLSTALAIGACSGAVLATRRSSRPTQLFLVGVAVAFSLVEVFSGLMPTYALTALLLVPTGWLMLTLTTAANSFTQLGVEPTMQGRVMSLYVLCFLGGAPLGAPAIGWLANTFGARWSLIGGGLLDLVVMLALAAVIAHRRGLPPEYLGRRARMATQFAHA
jgi:MFS family permease